MLGSPICGNSHIASRTGLLEPLAGFPEGLAGAARRTTGSSSAARHHTGAETAGAEVDMGFGLRACVGVLCGFMLFFSA